MRKAMHSDRIGDCGRNVADASGAVSVIGFGSQFKTENVGASCAKSAAPGREPRGHDFSPTHLTTQGGVSRHMMSVPIIARPKTQVTGSRPIGWVIL